MFDSSRKKKFLEKSLASRGEPNHWLPHHERMTTPAKLQVTSLLGSKHLQIFGILLYVPLPVEYYSASEIMGAWLRLVSLALSHRLPREILCEMRVECERG
jgi:hypothetical protein